ncbi:hypothetical protein EVC62_02265 [Salinicola endophyticus]|uniref:Uncharacterized protein n=1 Tax=Salinicola endophyticus TaxID=1949083 RepID=A0ABY8FGW8_9GAMM|nr:hypothetical protein [Salinicola endophyticus]WFF40416.1 hypothetical protein EVC62_02265 [Salinicola endophyticus]
MNLTQARALREVCREGGKLTLPTTDGPLTVEVTVRQPGNVFDRRVDARFATGETTFTKLNGWPCLALFDELATRIDDQYQVLSDADDAPEVHS